MQQQPVRTNVVRAVRDIVRREMGRFGLRSVKVRPGEDHDGDPVLWIEVEYGPDGDPIDTDVMAGLGLKIWDRLWELGETRFPHIRNHMPEDKAIAGEP